MSEHHKSVFSLVRFLFMARFSFILRLQNDRLVPASVRFSSHCCEDSPLLKVLVSSGELVLSRHKDKRDFFVPGPQQRKHPLSELR